MPITRTPIIDDDGSGTTGTVIDNAFKQQLYDQIDALGGPGGGAWQAMAFSAGNFTATGAGGGVWTVGAGHVNLLHWTIVGGTTVLVLFRLTGAMTLSNTATFLDIQFPAAVPGTNLGSPGGVFHYYFSGAIGTGECELSSNKLRLLRDVGGTSWPAFSSGYLIGQIYYGI